MAEGTTVLNKFSKGEEKYFVSMGYP